MTKDENGLLFALRKEGEKQEGILGEGNAVVS